RVQAGERRLGPLALGADLELDLVDVAVGEGEALGRPVGAVADVAVLERQLVPVPVGDAEHGPAADLGRGRQVVELAGDLHSVGGGEDGVVLALGGQRADGLGLLAGSVTRPPRGGRLGGGRRLGGRGDGEQDACGEGESGDGAGERHRAVLSGASCPHCPPHSFQAPCRVAYAPFSLLAAGFGSVGACSRRSRWCWPARCWPPRRRPPSRRTSCCTRSRRGRTRTTGSSAWTGPRTCGTSSAAPSCCPGGRPAVRSRTTPSSAAARGPTGGAASSCSCSTAPRARGR